MPSSAPFHPPPLALTKCCAKPPEKWRVTGFNADGETIFEIICPNCGVHSEEILESRTLVSHCMVLDKSGRSYEGISAMEKTMLTKEGLAEVVLHPKYFM